jgi:S1-C subfamily serine protease
VYKTGHPDNEPDIAVLSSSDSRVEPIDLETIPASEGQEVQVIGYPTASDQIDTESDRFYAPTFSTGRISRVTPHILQFDAPITSGNSGGPVVSSHGKLVGVVAVRALSSRGGELSNFGGAVSLQSIKKLAPELFGQ